MAEYSFSFNHQDRLTTNNISKKTHNPDRVAKDFFRKNPDYASCVVSKWNTFSKSFKYVRTIYP